MAREILITQAGATNIASVVARKKPLQGNRLGVRRLNVCREGRSLQDCLPVAKRVLGDRKEVYEAT